MNKLKKEYKIIILIIVILILIDQILKIIVANSGDVTLINGILSLNISKNINGTYGQNSNSTILYVITNLIVVVVVSKFIFSQNQFVDKKTKIFLSLIISGGISNIIDRLIRGFVIEFIKIGNLPAFNFADLCIAVGWISMIAIFTKFTANELKSRKKE